MYSNDFVGRFSGIKIVSREKKKKELDRMEERERETRTINHSVERNKGRIYQEIAQPNNMTSIKIPIRSVTRFLDTLSMIDII